MTTLEWHGRTYSVLKLDGSDGFSVLADLHHAIVDDQKAAVDWLACHSLRKGKARELVESALVKEVELTKT